MTQTNTKKLRIGISARALFDLEAENCVYEKGGIAAYRAYQREREGALLDPGPGYPMISALLRLSREQKAEDAAMDAVVMSRNSPDLVAVIEPAILHAEVIKFSRAKALTKPINTAQRAHPGFLGKTVP